MWSDWPVVCDCGISLSALWCPLSVPTVLNPKGIQSWIFIGRTDYWSWSSSILATWWEWCWQKLKAGGDVDDRGQDGWMASLTQWTWVWASSGSWWCTGKPGLLQSMGSQRVRQDWATEQQLIHGMQEAVSLIIPLVKDNLIVYNFFTITNKASMIFLFSFNILKSLYLKCFSSIWYN